MPPPLRGRPGRSPGWGVPRDRPSSLRHARERGHPVSSSLDSRVRGNDGKRTTADLSAEAPSSERRRMTTTKASTDTPAPEALDAATAKQGTDGGIVTCDACPVLCRIRPGKTGACDRYGNVAGRLTRMDPVVVTRRLADESGRLVPFLKAPTWDGSLISGADTFVTGIGAGTTYPDYKPAPFIVSSEVDGVDMVTVVTEGVFSYCGIKVKIDTDRYLGPECAPVRSNGEQVGHMTTAEYDSPILSFGRVHHLTGGAQNEGVATCRPILALGDHT